MHMVGNHSGDVGTKHRRRGGLGVQGVRRWGRGGGGRPAVTAAPSATRRPTVALSSALIGVEASVAPLPAA
jgi:hypothetical protein